MQRYKNLGGKSGVTAYEIGADFIKVKFGVKEPYVYTYKSAGAANVEGMKRLAMDGRGLATFINTTDIKEHYVR